jgi:hypothetical protein
MIQHRKNNPLGFREVVLLLLVSGSAVLLTSHAFADTGVTISADGSQSYYLGEKVVFRGQNTESDVTYLFLTGPNLRAAGVNLNVPDKAVVSGDPDSFTAVKTRPDTTWEYSYYTANLPLDAGTYSVYAIAQPKVKDQPDMASARAGIALKKPFITATVSPSNGTKGQSFTVTGIAEGIPPEVQAWILGSAYTSTTKIPVDSSASFTFTTDDARGGKLPAGQYYLIVEHPMADNQFDFVASGDYVRSVKLNNGTNLFRLTGPGSLQGTDAADALIAALTDSATYDDTYQNDTYTLLPFRVDETGTSASPTQPTTTTPPVQSEGQHSPLVYAPVGAIVLVLAMVAWKRQ